MNWKKKLTFWTKTRHWICLLLSCSMRLVACLMLVLTASIWFRSALSPQLFLTHLVNCFYQSLETTLQPLLTQALSKSNALGDANQELFTCLAQLCAIPESP